MTMNHYASKQPLTEGDRVWVSNPIMVTFGQMGTFVGMHNGLHKVILEDGNLPYFYYREELRKVR